MRSFSKCLSGLFALALALTACADAPTEPQSFEPASLDVAPEAAAFRGALSARPGDPLLTVPAIVLTDSRGLPVPGATVRFSVTRGGGSVEFATALTDSRGVASAGQWTLGPDAGANEMAAIVDRLPEVRFRAEAIAPAFSISVRYVNEPRPEYVQALRKAVRRWESIIASDLADYALQSPAASCFANQPELNETVDDLVIVVELIDIDGPGQYLGEAGPCYLRADNLLPVMGYLKLDVADAAQLESANMLEDLLLHEIGHVLGVGTLWQAKGLLQGVSTEDPRVHGLNALATYRQLGGLDTGVPAENSGSAITRNVHWRESVFNNELMTGYIGSGPNPLSALTIATLQDLGYAANPDAASSFVMNNVPQARTRLDLHDQERVIRPRFTIDVRGRRELIAR